MTSMSCPVPCKIDTDPNTDRGNPTHGSHQPHTRIPSTPHTDPISPTHGSSQPHEGSSQPHEGSGYGGTEGKSEGVAKDAASGMGSGERDGIRWAGWDPVGGMGSGARDGIRCATHCCFTGETAFCARQSKLGGSADRSTRFTASRGTSLGISVLGVGCCPRRSGSEAGAR